MFFRDILGRKYLLKDMASKQLTVDTRAELADLVKRKAEIAVSI